MRRLAALAALLLAVGAVAGCFGPLPACRRDAAIPAFAPGDHGLSLCIDGQQRTALAYVPAGVEAPVPLLLMLHGGAGSGHQMRKDNGMDPVAVELGFVVVYADGTPARRGSDIRTWNAAHCCGTAYREGSDDVAFLGALLEVLRDEWPIDETRVGVAGHSNGGMMAHRLAAERADLVTSAMPVAGAIGGEPTPGADVRRIPGPSGPVSVLVVHARDDPQVLYEGGVGQGFFGQHRTDLAVSDALSYWRAANGLDEASQQTAKDGDVEHHEWSGGTLGTALVLLSTAGGHAWPGSQGNFLASAPPRPDASREVGTFLLAHPRDPLPS